MIFLRKNEIRIYNRKQENKRLKKRVPLTKELMLANDFSSEILLWSWDDKYVGEGFRYEIEIFGETKYVKGLFLFLDELEDALRFCGFEKIADNLIKV